MKKIKLIILAIYFNSNNCYCMVETSDNQQNSIMEHQLIIQKLKEADEQIKLRRANSLNRFNPERSVLTANTQNSHIVTPQTRQIIRPFVPMTDRTELLTSINNENSGLQNNMMNLSSLFDSDFGANAETIRFQETSNTITTNLKGLQNEEESFVIPNEQAPKIKKKNKNSRKFFYFLSGSTIITLFIARVIKLKKNISAKSGNKLNEKKEVTNIVVHK